MLPSKTKKEKSLHSIESLLEGPIVFLLNLETGFLEGNKNLNHIFSISYNRKVNLKMIEKKISYGYLTEFRDFIKKLPSTRSTKSMKFPIHRKNEKKHFLELKTRIINSSNIVKFPEIICTIEDIQNKEKVIQEQLSIVSNLSRFQTISKEGLVILKEGKIIDINPAFEKMVGFTKKEMVGKLVSHFVAKSNLTVFKERSLKLDEKPFEIELFHKNGKLVTVKTQGSNFNYQGEELRFVVVREITKEKKLINFLSEKSRVYEFMFDEAPDAMLLITARRIIIDINKEGLKQLKIKGKLEQLGKRLEGFSPKYQPDGELSTKKASRLIKEALKGKKGVITWKVKRLDGTEFYSELTLNLIRYEGKKLIHIINRDITERIEYEEKILALNNHLETKVIERTFALQKRTLQVEEKNKNILDSLRYARGLQKAMLPEKEFLTEVLGPNFVFEIPRDIVSGDLFWIHSLSEHEVLFAVIDCTGHGVPGALLSIIAYTGITRICASIKDHHPSIILDLLIENANRLTPTVNDGMDIALCKLNKKTLQLEYAGANIPLSIVRNKNYLEIKGNNQPIGFNPISAPYDNHIVQLEKDDMVYLFTDGYRDQFGSVNNKKLKSGRFKALLTSISSFSVEDQNETLGRFYEQWKGQLPQVDDICILGLRV